MVDFKALREKNLIITKKKLQQSLKKDQMIVQAINNIHDLERVTNTLSKRLRDWYEFYFPEISKRITDHERFAEVILKKDKKELMKELHLKESIGSEMSETDLKPVKALAREIVSIFKLRKSQVDYIESVMKEYCPNILALTGALIGGKLLEHIGSLEKFSECPSSRIQLVGAEKALFRHMKSGARCPKHGLIHEHPMILQAKAKDRGKVARVLADKISIAAKIDYFKGEFIGDKLRKELEKRFK